MSHRQAAKESAALVVSLVEPSATTARCAKVRVALFFRNFTLAVGCISFFQRSRILYVSGGSFVHLHLHPVSDD
jgi:hypothetical protein